MKLRKFGVREPSNVVMDGSRNIQSGYNRRRRRVEWKKKKRKKRTKRQWQRDNDKQTKTKKTKTTTLILRRRVELGGRGVSRECRRPAQASVQAAVCRASQRVLTEWRGERAQARAGQLPPVSVHSVYCPQRLQHLPRPTYLAHFFNCLIQRSDLGGWFWGPQIHRIAWRAPVTTRGFGCFL